MKRITTILIATIVAFLSFAFVKAAKQSKLDVQVWYYTGPSSQTVTELNTASNYSLSNPGSECLTSGSSICSIMDEANAGGTQPALSQGTVSTSNNAYTPGFRR